MKILQLKAEISGAVPVWRRVLIEESFTFRALHQALQAAFGWQGDFPYAFAFPNGAVSAQEDADYPAGAAEAGTFFRCCADCAYRCGGLEIRLVLETESVPDYSTHYPCCTGGENAAPPLDGEEAARPPSSFSNWGNSRPPEEPPDPHVWDPQAVNIRLEDVADTLGARLWLPPTPDQWAKLYAHMAELKPLFPKEDEEIKIFAVKYGINTSYCVLSGSVNTGRTLLIYPDEEAFNSFSYVMAAGEEMPDYLVNSYQNAIACHFGDREDLRAEETSVLRSLGLRFRGRGQWPFIRSLRTGFAPWPVHAAQAAALETLFPPILDVAREIHAGRLNTRLGDPDRCAARVLGADGWENTSIPLPEPNSAVKRLVITDELLIARLRRHPCGGGTWEADLVYLPYAIQESSRYVPYYPAVVIICNAFSGTLVAYRMAEGHTKEETLLDAFAEAIQENDRPFRVHVRDERFAYLAEDLCDKTGMHLRMTASLPAIDLFTEEFFRHFVKV